MDIPSTLEKLRKSKFRNSFHLKEKDIIYIKQKGWNTIKAHCFDIISQRLAPAIIPNDGKQTPTHGHPVFPAQHACACCCRGCLAKWHNIPIGTQIPNEKIQELIDLLISWMEDEINNYKPKATNNKTKKEKPQPIQLTLFC